MPEVWKSSKHAPAIKMARPRVGVVIPCFRVRNKIAGVVKAVSPEVERIYCIDDACPEKSGQHLKKTVKDRRLSVIFHQANKGVGGAMKTGYRQALKEGMNIIVKVDGDGQINPALIPDLITPILLGQADYTKGNRFYNLEDLAAMPALRLFGNAGLSFLAKLSSGYWHLFDPNNGLTAIHSFALSRLPLDKVSDGYLFETDMLFRLGTIGAVLREIPMTAVYRDEKSGINELSSVFRFFGRHMKNFAKRIFYNYILRDFNIASLELLLGVPLFLFGVIFGAIEWINSIRTGISVTSGTVMLAALPIILGMQFILAFFNFDTRRIDLPPLFVRNLIPGLSGKKFARKGRS